MTEDEIEQAREDIHDLFDDVRADMADDLGGDPEDYQAESSAAPDGGE